jgi:poly(3-hydroxybutyrate) depolymerase
MTAYYLAARYSRNPELCEYRDELCAKIPGSVVTSRWIDQHAGELEASYTPEDLDAAQVIVSFTGAGGGGKGGRHIEHGYAIAAGKRLVVVGPRENIFHCHPATEVYATWDDFLAREAGDHG